MRCFSRGLVLLQNETLEDDSFLCILKILLNNIIRKPNLGTVFIILITVQSNYFNQYYQFHLFFIIIFHLKNVYLKFITVYKSTV